MAHRLDTKRGRKVLYKPCSWWWGWLNLIHALFIQVHLSTEDQWQYMTAARSLKMHLSPPPGELQYGLLGLRTNHRKWPTNVRLDMITGSFGSCVSLWCPGEAKRDNDTLSSGGSVTGFGVISGWTNRETHGRWRKCNLVDKTIYEPMSILLTRLVI